MFDADACEILGKVPKNSKIKCLFQTNNHSMFALKGFSLIMASSKHIRCTQMNEVYSSRLFSVNCQISSQIGPIQQITVFTVHNKFISVVIRLEREMIYCRLFVVGVALQWESNKNKRCNMELTKATYSFWKNLETDLKIPISSHVKNAFQ